MREIHVGDLVECFDADGAVVITATLLDIDYSAHAAKITFASGTAYWDLSYVRPATNLTGPSYAELVELKNAKGCVCGSHQPKGPGHSTWCDVYA